MQTIGSVVPPLLPPVPVRCACAPPPPVPVSVPIAIIGAEVPVRRRFAPIRTEPEATTASDCVSIVVLSVVATTTSNEAQLAATANIAVSRVRRRFSRVCIVVMRLLYNIFRNGEPPMDDIEYTIERGSVQ